jgi:hypothetical protein
LKTRIEKLKSSTKNKNKMKTNIILTIAILAVNLNLALANNTSTIISDKPVELKMNPFTDLAPVTPQAATFEEELAVYIPACMVPCWQFSTPAEADFSDIVPEPAVDITLFAPVTPKEATFEDEMNCGAVICSDALKSLAPVAPKEADFNTNPSPMPDQVIGG